MSMDVKNYRFDDVTIDCENFHVQKNGEGISLTPRAFDVLIFLIKNGDRVVEKQEIFDSVWKDAFVSDNALTKIIKEIRHSLDDSPDKPRYIETVVKRGYRFIGKPDQPISKDGETGNGHAAPLPDEPDALKAQGGDGPITQPFAFSKRIAALVVVSLLVIAGLAAWLMRSKPAVETSSAPIRSIAVLPFRPLNSDSRDGSLELGMAETLITRLSNLRQFTVRPLSSVSKYADVQEDAVKAGLANQVEAVLDGSIQKAGDRIRVTVRLINVSDGATLWSEQFDESFVDIFKVQDSIAERVMHALTPQLTRQEKEQLVKHHTDNPKAYQLYLQGQYIRHRRPPNAVSISLEYYLQALEADPNFALAHVEVAECYLSSSGWSLMTGKEAAAKAKPSVMRALEIDDTLAEAHNALAEIMYQLEYDWIGAAKEFERAIELNPNVASIRLAYGWFLMTNGRFDEADIEMETARTLGPTSLVIGEGKGNLFYFSRQYDRALEHYQMALTAEPDLPTSYFHLGEIYEQ